MATLNGSSSSLAVKQAYDDNASYREDNSVTKVKIFITAVAILMRRTASQMTKGGNAVSLRPDLLKQELDDAKRWLEARDTDSQPGPRSARSNFRNFRR